MTVIKDATKICEEVLRGEVLGAVKLYRLDDPTRPESSAKRMLGMTYPAQALRHAMAAIEEGIQGKLVKAGKLKRVGEKRGTRYLLS